MHTGIILRHRIELCGIALFVPMQTDVTARVEAERKLVELTAAQTGMLEQVGALKGLQGGRAAQGYLRCISYLVTTRCCCLSCCVHAAYCAVTTAPCRCSRATCWSSWWSTARYVVNSQHALVSCCTCVGYVHECV